MTQAPTPGPLSGDDVKLLVKLLDTLKPFAEVAEKLKHCHVVEICEPTPDNPSRNIVPMPREWFERAGDDLEYIAIQLHAAGVLSEGQASKVTGLDRVEVRREVDRLAPTAPVEASGSERPIAWVGLQGNRFSEKPVVLGDGEMWIGGRPIPDSVIKQTTPLALGGQHSSGEDAAWSWLNRHVECDPADRDYSADEMVDAFMAGAGRYDIWLKALERIAGEQQHRSGYCQTDITVEPALTAEEAQTVARDALSTTPARAEAQDEGAAGEFVEPYAWIWRDMTRLGLGFTRDPSVVSIKREQGCEIQPLYAHPSPTPAADDDKLRIAVEALEEVEHLIKISPDVPSDDFDRGARAARLQAFDIAYAALSALKSTTAKEGGAK